MIIVTASDVDHCKKRPGQGANWRDTGRLESGLLVAGEPGRRGAPPHRADRQSLFAAVDTATRVTGECCPRHRTAEFHKFLDEVEARTPRVMSTARGFDASPDQLRFNVRRGVGGRGKRTLYPVRADARRRHAANQ